MEKKKIIVVLGMHRSGTSAAMKAIETLGVSIGDNLMPAAKNNNPKGFFEDMDINLLNIEMLSVLGNDWDHLSFITPKDIENLIALGYKQKAFDILNAKLNTSNYFGFKDPRVSKLIEFWKIVFAELNCEIIYVCSIRNPFSVAKSLEVRDGFIHIKSYLLWLSYNITTIIGLREHSFIVVDYDDLIANPIYQTNRISDHLGIEPDEQKIATFSSDFIDDSLRHSLSNLQLLKDDPHCPKIVEELYKLLSDCTAQKSVTTQTMPALFELCTKSRIDMDYTLQLLDQMDKEHNRNNGEIIALKSKMESIENKIKAPLHNTMRTVSTKVYTGIDDGDGIAYSEEKAVSVPYCIGEGRRSITYNLESNCINNYSHLRFDIADMPCFIEIYSMQLTKSDGEMIWQWEPSSNESLWSHSKDIHIINRVENNSLYLASLSDDPQLHLNIKEHKEELPPSSIILIVDLSISALAEHSKKALESLASVRNELIIFQQYDELVRSDKSQVPILSTTGIQDLEKSLLLAINKELEKSAFNIASNNEASYRTIESQYLELKKDIKANNDIAQKMTELFQIEKKQNDDKEIYINQLQAELSDSRALLSQYKNAHESISKSTLVKTALYLSGNKALYLSCTEN